MALVAPVRNPAPYLPATTSFLTKPLTLTYDVDKSSDNEKKRILRDAQKGVRQVTPSTISHLFEKAVGQFADKPAVQYETDEPVTFDQLNAASNQLARALSVSPGSIVPVCLDRSVELVISLLAILKSGAAYTVLDPDAPSQRAQAIIETCNASRVLVQRKYAGRFKCSTWIMEDVLSNAAQLDGSNLSLKVSPNSMAYIIFTSGSTGTPKGVVVTHSAATSGMACHHLHGLSRWLLFFNPVFSAAQRTMLSTLVHGATLLLASKERLMRNLASLLKEMNVDALGITPSALSTLRPEAIPSVKRITLVGERIPQEIVDAWADTVVLFNSYGLSECTQINFSQRLSPGCNPRIVGRPVDTTAAYVLTPSTLNLAPVGTPGELCLTGAQLAQGYLGLPDETARVFVSNPFGQGRLYRTGDVARMHEDGSIEIVGRIDFQAKIGGQKVDPSEVDEVMVKHPAVARCATVPVDLSDGQDFVTLVAAVVLDDSCDQNWTEITSSLREHAASMLPGYMVPCYWLSIQELPTNGNGKLDRRMLQRMIKELGVSGLAAQGMDITVSQDMPSSATELMIAEAWSSVLTVSLDIISRKHSFVSLGGSSIQALRVMSVLQEKGLEADLGQLLDPAMTLERAACECILLDGALYTNPLPFSLLEDEDMARRIQADTSVVDAYPATPLQESLLSSLESGETDQYTYQRIWEVSHLDLVKLRQSIAAAYERSDVLRTSFQITPKGYLQLVHSGQSLPWVESDLNLAAFLRQDKRMRFTVAGPLIRFSVVEKKFLVVATHHSLFDYWSHRFLYHDAADAYLGLPPAIRPPFSRFARHLEAYHKDQNHDDYWKRYLESVEHVVLPTDDAASTTIVSQALPQIGSKMRDAGLTPGCILYAAWAILLWQRTSGADVVFATTFSGREVAVPGVATMDGPTLTTVPQRIVVKPSETVAELCKRVAAGLYELVRHSQTGMRKALALGKVDATDVDTLVNILVKDAEPSHVEQVFRRHGKRSIWSSPRLTMEVEVDGDDLQLHLVGKISERRGNFLLEAYLQLVKSLVDQPKRLVSELDNMGHQERELVERHLSHQDTLMVPEPELLHAKFERIAYSEPDRVAVDWNGQQELTYRQLNERADLVASRLVSLGTQVGERIPLVLDKSLDMMPVILGVLKAGAAYVPLSPSNPLERNQFIINDVEAKRIIAAKDHASVFAALGRQLIVAENITQAEATPAAPCVQVRPSDLAYIIYTSGSTGTPKGVRVPHSSAASAVESMAVVEGRYHGEWRTLQFANYVFDASCQDFFNTLSTGGTLCMAPTDELQSDLAGTINRMRVAQAILTPTVAKLLQPEEVPTMKKMILGGEPLPQDVIEKWLPHSQILNVYGPTETSMVVTTKDVVPGDRPGNIGPPFPTVRAFLVDADCERLVPYGSIGELCIAGPQVAGGYVGRPDLTAAAFTTKMNSVLGVNCLYRTGDLARWLPNGDIECLGRKDNQVKIHGYRIELAEIEQAIIKSGLVQDGSVAVIPLTINKQICLSAFCVYETKPSAPAILNAADHISITEQLYARLDSLAHYMLPKYIFPLNAFPKLPSQKTDRKTLKKWAEDMDGTRLAEFAATKLGGTDETADNFEPVETEEEVALEAMWSAVFGLPADQKVGRNSSFMSLGGDSIAAIRLVGLCRNQGYSLSVQSVLKKNKLGDIAETMKRAETRSSAPRKQFAISESVMTRIQQSDLDFEKDVDYVYPCPPGQGEFLSQGARDEQVWQLMAVRAMETIEPAEWFKSTKQLAEIHDILRTSWVQDEDGTWVGVVLRSSELLVQYHDCENDEEKQAFIDGFWKDRFSFGAPFIKFAVIKDPASRKWDLVIKMDHAVYDGTLFRIFDEHWEALRSNRPLPRHGEFRDFAFHSYSTDNEPTLEYWKNMMKGKEPTFDDKKNEPVTDSVFRKLLDVNLEEVAKKSGVTPAIIFQTAHQLWLAKRSRGGDGTVGFDYLLSGRNVESTIDPQTINGTMANFLPIQSHWNQETTIMQYLNDSQDAFWAATEHGNVGLDQIYHAAGLDRATYANKTLFLFQPFDPIPPNTTAGEIENTRWLPLSKSLQTRLLQPYELVVEVGKAVSDYRLAIYYDSSLRSSEEVRQISEEFINITCLIAARYEDGSIRDVMV
ncbi:hypothetical protein HIM_03003 [Hirsutella minnesotensis 3608]|nr:hypothetical protein HIM_03003 [Hirsutella minnesotensis 3608]